MGFTQYRGYISMIKVEKKRCHSFVVLLACTVMALLADGVLRSFGLFYVAMLAEFKESVSVTTLITGIYNAIFCLSSLPIMMFLIKVIQPRIVVIIGSVLTSLGYSLSCLAPNIYFLLFTISLIAGVGNACICPPAIFVIGTYFPTKRTTATSIVLSGCCLGGLLCPPIYQYFLDNYGIRGALLLTGGVLLHNIPLAGLLRNTKYCADKTRNNHADNTLRTIPNSNKKTSICNLLTDPTFLLFVLALSIANTITSTFTPYLPLYATEHNIDKDKMVILVSLTGVCDFVGRLLSGLIADTRIIEIPYIIAFSQIVCGVVYNCNQVMTNFAGLVCFAVFIGLFGSMYLPLMHSYTAEKYGQEIYPSAAAILIVSQLPVFVFGPLCFGLLRDSTGNFIVSFHVVGTVGILSAVLLICVPMIEKCSKSVNGDAANEIFSIKC